MLKATCYVVAGSKLPSDSILGSFWPFGSADWGNWIDGLGNTPSSTSQGSADGDVQGSTSQSSSNVANGVSGVNQVNGVTVSQNGNTASYTSSPGSATSVTQTDGSNSASVSQSGNGYNSIDVDQSTGIPARDVYVTAACRWETLSALVDIMPWNNNHLVHEADDTHMHALMQNHCMHFMSSGSDNWASPIVASLERSSEAILKLKILQQLVHVHLLLPGMLTNTVISQTLRTWAHSIIKQNMTS